MIDPRAFHGVVILHILLQAEFSDSAAPRHCSIAASSEVTTGTPLTPAIVFVTTLLHCCAGLGAGLL